MYGGGTRVDSYPVQKNKTYLSGDDVCFDGFFGVA